MSTREQKTSTRKKDNNGLNLTSLQHYTDLIQMLHMTMASSQNAENKNKKET